MRRALLSAVGVIAALVLQLTVVNRLPWPGGAAPDVVLLVVVALGLYSSPAAGAVTGFLAGLSLDIAPPGSYLIGTYALAFCLVGYGCGRLRGLLGDSVWRSVGAAVLAATAGEVLVSAVGRLVGNPQVTWSAIRQVLPATIVYDAVLAPFVLYLVMRVLTWAAALGPVNHLAGAQLARSQSPAQARSAAALPGGAGLLGGTGWLSGPRGARSTRGSSAGRIPRLREAAARTGDGWIGGSPAARRSAAPRRGVGRPPRLRPASGQAGSSAAIRLHAPLPRRPVKLRLGSTRRRGGAARPGTGSVGLAYQRRTGAAPAGPSFRSARGSGPRGSAFRGAGGSGPRGSAFRGAGSRPVGSAFGGSPSRKPRGSAFRSSGSGPGAPSFRGAAHGPAGKAIRGSGRPGPAFAYRRAGGGRSLLAGSGAAARAPRFRPDGRLSGGSAFGSPKRRARPARSVTLRLRPPRRRDGVLSSGLARGPRRRRGRNIRPVRLRLGGNRRGDGMVAGLVPPGRRFGRRARRAAPRFRGQSAGSPVMAGRRVRLGTRKQARFRSGHRSLLATWTRGRLGSRSSVWRIGSTRIGGPS
jgi:rod shape-determining protein MreD